MSSAPPQTPVNAQKEALLAAARFDAQGLISVVAQDRATGVVRMVAWANREALERTVDTGLAHFWSRSRQSLWQKGETTGHVLHVRQVRVDCDGDTLLYLVDAVGPSCHTGASSCFFRLAGPEGLVDDGGPTVPEAGMVARVADVIATRRRERPERSYVVSLLDAGWEKILGKITEEAGEVVEALPSGDRKHATHEAADVIFHLLVGLEAAGIPFDDVCAELRRRFGTSGIDEKAQRGKPAP